MHQLIRRALFDSPPCNAPLKGPKPDPEKPAKSVSGRVTHLKLVPTQSAADSRIVEGLFRRDPAALTDLYDAYSRVVYSIVYRVLQNRGEAEEVVQDVFLRVWNRSHLLDNSRGAIRPWLLTIARNLAIDHLRVNRLRGYRLEHTTYEDFPGPAAFDLDFSHSERSECLRQAFAGLRPEQRTVIELAYFEGLSQLEISARLEKPLGTVKTWVRTALSVLRESLSTPAHRAAPTESNQARRRGLARFI